MVHFFFYTILSNKFVLISFSSSFSCLLFFSEFLHILIFT